MLLAVTVMTLSFSSLLVFFQSVLSKYKAASMAANDLKAKYIARSGLETAITMLNKVPSAYLRQFGLMPFTPPVPIGDGSVFLRIEEERGKLNVNHLVNSFNDEPNTKNVERFQRLLQHFSMSPELVDGIIDWIDKNNIRMPAGYEKADYARMNPPRNITNSPMFSINELLFIPGFSADLIYKDNRTEVEKKMFSQDFVSEEEKDLITDADYILANSLTAALTKNNLNDHKINLNSAGYHVLLSLSPFITPVAAKAILKERKKSGGYFKNLNQLQKIPQLNFPVKTGVTLYQWIESEITLDDKIFLIEAHSRYQNHTAVVKGIYDKQERRLSLYLE